MAHWVLWPAGMGAKSYRELVVYQRCVELRARVLAITATDRARRDRKLCEQTLDAVRSPPRNIAEGFGRYNPAEFAQFLDVAIASLDELDNHLRDGVDSELYAPQPSAEAIALTARCRWMVVRLRAYLHREAARRRQARSRRPPRS